MRSHPAAKMRSHPAAQMGYHSVAHACIRVRRIWDSSSPLSPEKIFRYTGKGLYKLPHPILSCVGLCSQDLRFTLKEVPVELRPQSKICIFSYLQSCFEFSLMALKNSFTHPLDLSSNVFCEHEEDSSTFKQDNTAERPKYFIECNLFTP